MESRNIYQDIAQRTGGDIYIGVVGPVRTGKSTFIKKFMEKLVIPNIESEFSRERAVDELPQSAAGKTIMTTEPKFIPEEAVKINLNDSTQFKVRMIDCVGYIVPSSLGYVENEQPRMVMTPWFEQEIPFNMAAEIGTQKVIQEHSTIGLVVTSDGSISEIPREEYQEAEERVIDELRELKKPFAVLLNCADPKVPQTKELRQQMEIKYQVPVVALNCLELEEEDILKILENVLMEFPIKEIKINIPHWILSLEQGHWLKDTLYQAICKSCGELSRLSHLEEKIAELKTCPHIQDVQITGLDLGVGKAMLTIFVKANLFYDILEEATGLEIGGEEGLLPCLRQLSKTKKEYDKVKSALEEVSATGYGIVMPSLDELTLEEPELIRKGGRYGVNLKASAPSIHMMRADITTEVSPIVGSEKQSEELVMSLLKEFEDDPQKIWDSNIFGKSLYELVNEGLHNKLYRMPADARLKMQETIERMINEGCKGLICLIL